MSRIKEWLIKRKYSKMQEYFRTVDSEELRIESERKVLAAFHFAAKKVPAYKNILHKHRLNPKHIKTIKDFRDYVPILNKNDLFVDYPLRDVSVGGNFGGPVNFFMSSGYSGSGNYSYGIEDNKGYKKAALYTEFLLNLIFNIFDRKTLVINGNIGGIRLPTRRLSVADVVARPEPVFALLNKLSGDFDQFLVLGEQPFIQDLVEKGVYNKFHQCKKPLFFITGGDFMPENYRTHLASILKMDFDNPDTGMLYHNFGTTEVALSMFNEDINTIRIRRLAEKDAHFKKTLFKDTKYIPSIMHYFPQNIYVEHIWVNNIPQLVVSSLDMTRKIPMIRYCTGDCVMTMPYITLCNKLRHCGYSHLCPEYHLPVGLIWDRRRMQKWK